jgi:hypothetical protein
MNNKFMVILTILASFAFTEANSQINSYKIAGKAFIDENKPAEAATVILLNARDSSIAKIDQVDVNGSFVFVQIQQGNYLVSVAFTGFQKYVSETVHVDSASQIIELHSIMLRPISKSLKEITVISKKPFIEQKIDRTVVNITNMTSAAGNNTLEVLEKLPGVIVDQNGTVIFKGKSGVMILIDGKQTYLSGDNLSNYLKSLPASQLDQIELMPNPPAKYEAAGNAGVINIKTKKTKAKGLNGSLATSIGKSRLWRANETVTINYRTGKLNLFANAGYSLQNSYRKLDLQRNYFDTVGSLISEYKSLSIFKPTIHNPSIKTGIEFYISPKTTIGLSYTGSISSSSLQNPVSGILLNSTGLIDSTIIADNNARSKFKNSGLTFNYSHQFDGSGKTISFDLDYIKYKAENDQSFLNNIFYPNGNIKSTQLITSNLPAAVNIYAAKSDYTQSLKNKGQFEAGIKTSYVSTDNAANYYNYQNNLPVIDYNFTNQFFYKENINAAYINFRKEVKRISFQAGLRLENTNAKGHQAGNPLHSDSGFTQHYTNLFPTAFLSYELDSAGLHLVKLSYGRRIDRPYYKDLNPFVTIVDKFTNFSGNPYLKPQLSSNYELTYSYKSFLSVSFAYSYTSNYQIETVRQQGDVFISSTTNLGSREYKAVNASSTFSPAKWWNCNLYGEVVNLSFNSISFDKNFVAQKTYWYIEANNQFELPHNWGIQVSGFYISPRVTGQFILDAKGALNAGVYKKILNNKVSIRLSASDILRTNISSGSISNIAGATSTYHNDFDTKMLSLSLSYNFGSSGNNPRKRNTGSSQSEQNRIKN